jgi:hypothetical protein
VEILTLPVPPSPTRTSLKVGFSAIMKLCVDAKVFRECLSGRWCVATTKFSVARVVCCVVLV